ncbi:hypothetical protein ACHQM5_001707 [Ranunculus cassubicifolius]
MDEWTKSLRGEEKFRPHRSKNPSFSSSLLDAIYRSIDEGEEDEFVVYKETMKSTTTATAAAGVKFGARKEAEMDDFRRACLIEKWMEKKVSEKVVVRRKSVPDFTQKRASANANVFHSASSSSDSSSAGFSSSEAESLYTSRLPKPIKTSLSSKTKPEPLQYHDQKRYDGSSQKAKEGGFNKTKSRAMKIYGDLKKVKQPISPGGKLASFLNSLFTAGNTKKAKLSTSVNGLDERQYNKESTQTSTCSSASSFSRSCLSKTPSSRGGGTKRSVRFYPVSVIVDEDSRPCGHKSLYEPPKENFEELKFHLMEKNRKIEEAAKEFLKGYQQSKLMKKNDEDYQMRDAMQDYPNDYEDDEDDDAESYASSDLFELDNFAAIGIERCREELPVYETTYLDKNRPISNGFRL